MFVQPAVLNTSRQLRSGVAVISAVLLIFVLGVTALAVDLGYLFWCHGQLQNAADAGALAAAQVLINDGWVKAVPEYTSGQNDARDAAAEFVSYNPVGIDRAVIETNASNDPGGDVVLGYLRDPDDPNCQLEFGDPSKYNAVQVRVHRSSAINGMIPTFFSQIWGSSGKQVSARATALMGANINGFKVTSESGNCGLLPFAVKKTDWDALLDGAGSDNYTYDDSGAVSGGGDGIREMNMFPLSNGSGGVAPGNFGTVDVGNPNNSTPDLERQISYGVSQEDLAYIGGSLVLGDDGTLLLNGDTGVSAAIKDELEAIKGRPRVIMLYSVVEGQGNNAMYTIVGFAGVRVMFVKLTGSMSEKRIIVQPCIAIDPSAIIGDGPNQSKFVYSNVRLVR